MKFMLNIDYISVNCLVFESNKLGNIQHHIYNLRFFFHNLSTLGWILLFRPNCMKMSFLMFTLLLA